MTAENTKRDICAKRKSVSFEVDFIQGKQRPRFNARGKYIRAYTPRETHIAETRIAAAYRKASIAQHGEVLQHDGQVRVCIVASAKLPKSKTKPEPNMFKPDIDNIEKLVLDGLNGTAYEDDKQVTETWCRKVPRTKRDTDSTLVKVEFILEERWMSRFQWKPR